MDEDNFLDWFASVGVFGVKCPLVDFVKRPINEEPFCTKISKPIQCQGCDYFQCTYCNGEQETQNCGPLAVQRT